MKPNKEAQFFCTEVKGLMKDLMSKVTAGAVAFSLALTPSLPFAFAGNTTQLVHNQTVNMGTKTVQSPAQKLTAKMKGMLALLTKVVTIDPRTITTGGFKVKAAAEGSAKFGFVFDMCTEYTGKKCPSRPQNKEVKIIVSDDAPKIKTVSVNINQIFSKDASPKTIKVRPDTLIIFKVQWPAVTLKSADEKLSKIQPQPDERAVGLCVMINTRGRGADVNPNGGCFSLDNRSEEELARSLLGGTKAGFKEIIMRVSEGIPKSSAIFGLKPEDVLSRYYRFKNIEDGDTVVVVAKLPPS